MGYTEGDHILPILAPALLSHPSDRDCPSSPLRPQGPLHVGSPPAPRASAQGIPGAPAPQVLTGGGRGEAGHPAALAPIQTLP